MFAAETRLLDGNLHSQVQGAGQLLERRRVGGWVGVFSCVYDCVYAWVRFEISSNTHEGTDAPEVPRGLPLHCPPSSQNLPSNLGAA